MKMRNNRVLALIMVVALAMGLFPVRAMAALGEDAGSAGQIYRDEYGIIQYAEVDGDGALSAVDGNTVVKTAGGKVEIAETIAPTAWENQFDLTFTVQTKQEIGQEIVSPDMAVVLVMDLSDSMNDCCITCNGKADDKQHGPRQVYYCNVDGGESSGFSPMGFGNWYMCNTCTKWEKPADGGTFTLENHTLKNLSADHAFVSRLAQAQATTYTFLERYVENSGDAMRMVNIVAFDGNQQGRDVSGGWVDAKELSNMHGILYGAGMKTYGQTITEAGLLKAMDCLSALPKNEQGESISNSAVILMTDGDPTGAVSGASFPASTDWVTAEERAYYGGGIGYLWGMHSGRALQGKYGAPLYSVCYGNEPFDPRGGYEWLSQFSTKAYRATNADELMLSFENILNQIELRTKAWRVTIPMGPHMSVATPSADVNTNVSLGSRASTHYYDAVNRKMYWDLRSDSFTKTEDPENPGNAMYTYAMTLRVVLDPTDEGFEKDTYYPANLNSVAEFVFENEDGVVVDENGQVVANPTLQTLSFRVPQVKGVMPVLEYSIRFFQKEKTVDGGYVEVERDAILNQKGELNQIIPMPGDYLSKYPGYQFKLGGALQLTMGGANVMNLYYDPITTQIQESHYVNTITYDADGNRSESGFQLEKGPNVEGVHYVGDDYTPVLLNYPLDETQENSSAASIKLAPLMNTLNYYYTRTVGTEPGYVNVHYFLSESRWALNEEGRYYQEKSEPTEDVSQRILNHRGADGMPYTAPALQGGDGYVLDEAYNAELGQITFASGETQTINVYYTRPADDVLNQALVKVNHIYYTQIPGGGEQYAGANTVEDHDYYVNERFVASEETGARFGSDAWDCVTPDEDRMIDPLLAGTNEITLKYVRTADPAAVTVNHYYVDYIWRVDETGNALPVWPDDTSGARHEIESVTEGIYVGGSYTVQPKEQDSYHFESDYSDGLELGSLSASQEVNLYYGRLPEREEVNNASVTVSHIYRTYTTRVNPDTGLVENSVLTDTLGPVQGETVSGLLNEKVDLSPVMDQNGVTYDRVTFPTLNGAGKYSYTLSEAEGSVTFEYRRDVNELTEENEAYLTVTPKLVTVTTSIDQVTGERVTSENVVDGAVWSSQENGVTLYAAQAYGLVPGDFAQSGYDFNAERTNAGNALSYAAFRLGEAGSTTNVDLYFVQSMDERGDPQNVTVEHVYTLTEYAMVDGVRTETVTTLTKSEDAGKRYVGEFFETVGKAKEELGYTLDGTKEQPAERVQVGENGLTVTFYYSQTKDYTKAATLSVEHNYTWYNWDGTVNHEDRKSFGEGNAYYAGQSFTVAPDYYGGVFQETDLKSISWTRGGETVGIPTDALGISLTEGENTIVLTYAITLDNRVDSSVTVKHSYAVKDTYTGSLTDEGSVERVYTGVSEGAWLDGAFQAELLRTRGEGGEEKSYEFERARFGETELVEDADHAGYLSAVTLNGENNVIEITYLRTVDTTPTEPVPPEPERPDRPDRPDRPVRPTQPEQPVKPEQPDDEIIIDDEDIPLENLPVEENPPALPPEMEDEFLIVDAQIPLGNLPQTGSRGADKPIALGFLGLSLTLSAAGLMVLTRKKANKE